MATLQMSVYLVHSCLTERGWIIVGRVWQTLFCIRTHRSCVGVVRELRRTKTHSVGRWIKLNTHEEIGTVRAVRSTDKHVHKKYIAVEVWKQQGRKWVVSWLAWWRKSKIVEVKVKRRPPQYSGLGIGLKPFLSFSLICDALPGVQTSQSTLSMKFFIGESSIFLAARFLPVF